MADWCFNSHISGPDGGAFNLDDLMSAVKTGPLGEQRWVIRFSTPRKDEGSRVVVDGGSTAGREPVQGVSTVRGKEDGRRSRCRRKPRETEM